MPWPPTTYEEPLIPASGARPALVLGSDLLSGLVAARDAGDALSDDAGVATAILMFATGFENITNLIGNGVLALLQHRDELARTRNDPSLLRA